MTSPVLRRERGSNAPDLSGAHELKVSQQTISKIEQSETVDEQMLQQIASILGVSAEGIKNFSEEAVFNIISNTFNNESVAYVENYKCTFNPLDKLIEAYEENRKLYERLYRANEGKLS